VFKPTREFLLAFSALCAVILAVAFDATTLPLALPMMSSAIGGTALEAFWSGTSFLLASTVFQPTVAALSAIFGRKYVSRPPSLPFSAHGGSNDDWGGR
jgi:MFS family permease